VKEWHGRRSLHVFPAEVLSAAKIATLDFTPELVDRQVKWSKGEDITLTDLRNKGIAWKKISIHLN
jgi:hypothetical protein